MGALTGKTALVTGASRGIGRAIATRLAADGALVAVHYARDDQAAGETLRQIEAAGGRGVAVKAELGRPGDVPALLETFDSALAEAGDAPHLDILVNNAAVLVARTFDQVTAEDFDHAFAVNVRAPFFLVQQALGRMRDGGRIITIGSGVTRIAFPSVIAYSMTKGAMEVFTHTLASVLGPRGITVNTVAPGLVATDMNAGWLANPIVQFCAAISSVFGRVGRPDDIADIVAFLASPDARWITGQTLDATGGAQL